METYEKEYYVRGYHVYKDTLEAAIGEELECVREPSNAVDRYAVAVTNNRWPLTEDVSAHLLVTVFEKRWCDTVSRLQEGERYNVTLRAYTIFIL